jgi:hypothetical protein
MPNGKRRVQVRRTEPGANDPTQQARKAGILEGRAEAKAQYVEAISAAVLRAKADERAIRSEVMKRMEKEIEDLTARCAALEAKLRSGETVIIAEPVRDWHAKDTKEWIAPFDEDETQVRRQRRPEFQGDDPALEPGRDAPRRSGLRRS